MFIHCHSFKPISVEVVCYDGQYDSIMSLLRLLNIKNPYLCYVDVDVKNAVFIWTSRDEFPHAFHLDTFVVKLPSGRTLKLTEEEYREMVDDNLSYHIHNLSKSEIFELNQELKKICRNNQKILRKTLWEQVDG
jgi:hypothetical protein